MKSLPQPIHPACRRRGSLLVLVPILAVALMSVALLAVEWGRVQLVKGELQAAADAAALYAVTGTIDSAARSRAREAAAENLAHGQAISLSDEDIEFGQWDDASRTFSATVVSPNAVRVTARATIPLTLGSLIGMQEMSVSASAIGLGSEASSFGVAGIDFVRVNGNSVVDAYDSSAGSYSSTRGGGASIASNGYLEVTSGSYVYGDLWHRPGASVTAGSGAIVPPGERQLLTSAITFPPATLPPSYVNKGSHTQDKGALVLHAGNYRYSDLVINSGAKLVIQGQVNIYVTSKFEVNSISTGGGQDPSQLRIVGLGSATISVNSNSSLAAEIYAPGGAVLINSGSELYGTAVGRSVLINSGSELHHDKSLSATSAGKPRLVR